MRTERARRHQRRIPVQVTVGDTTHKGYTTDVSSTGMFIATSHMVPLKTRVKVEVLDGDRSFVFEAVVCRIRRVPPELRRAIAGGFGVRFIPMDELVDQLFPKKRKRYPVHIRRVGQLVQVIKTQLPKGQMLVPTEDPARVGEVVTVEIQPPTSDRSECFSARVIELDEEDGMRVEFVDHHDVTSTLQSWL